MSHVRLAGNFRTIFRIPARKGDIPAHRYPSGPIRSPKRNSIFASFLSNKIFAPEIFVFGNLGVSSFVFISFAILVWRSGVRVEGSSEIRNPPNSCAYRAALFGGERPAVCRVFRWGLKSGIFMKLLEHAHPCMGGGDIKNSGMHESGMP